jgi:hypothetical protein
MLSGTMSLEVLVVKLFLFLFVLLVDVIQVVYCRLGQYN